MRVIFFLLLVPLFSVSQNINIKLFSEEIFDEIVFAPVEGKYELVANNKVYERILPGDTLHIKIKGARVRVFDHDEWSFKVFLSENWKIKTFSSIHIRGVGSKNSFYIKPYNYKKAGRLYDDDIFVESSGTALSVINDVNFEKYIAGVVESEGGSKAHVEYYKTQAILCRTYAMKYFQKHLDQGFNLCDDVHCQAYKHKCMYNDTIFFAAEQTAGLVIVDKKLNIITATFHSNSGGQTANSEDVWVSAQPYLRGKEDTYSIGQHNYVWDKEISAGEWGKYLKKYGAVIDKKSSFSFNQRNRAVDYVYNGVSVPFTKIRSDWKLKSAYMSVEDHGHVVLLKGKGYGHGVGLSQEGAMKMADLGFSYKDIINHYYTGVTIMSIRALNFFKIE